MNENQDDHETSERPNKRRVTLRDIAKELGISHVSVSRALRNDPAISDKTKARVKKKAEEMGYHPDPMLSALSNYRLANQEKPVQASIAWINLFENPDELRKYKVFDQYWKGAFDTAKQFGFHLEEFRLAELPTHRLDSIFKARGIRGIVLTPSTDTEAQLNAKLDGFPWPDYATVRFGQSALFLKVNFISSSQVSNTITLFENIYRKGYKRIGFVGKYFRKFLFGAGYLWAQQAIPEEQRLPPLFYQEDDPSSRIQSMLADWMAKYKPDAVICEDGRIITMTENLGYRVPDDVAICAVSINDVPIDAGIDQNPEEIGRAAIRSLVSQLHENRFGIPKIQSEVIVEGQWVDGSMLPLRK